MGKRNKSGSVTRAAAKKVKLSHQNEPPEITIYKSPTDEHNRYKYIELDNGIRAVLITDTISCDEDSEENNNGCVTDRLKHFNKKVFQINNPNCTSCKTNGNGQSIKRSSKIIGKNCQNGDAAIAVTIGAGSLNEPDDAPGLAHLCEHMLFLGSEDYPEEGSLDKLISAGGKFPGANGTTYGSFTSYHYAIEGDRFRKSLDMFVSLFKNPLIPLKYIEKEVSVVDSEFQVIRTNEFVRRLQLLKSVGIKGHPVCNFKYGNKASLDYPPEELRELVLGFVEKWYCPDNMTIVLLGPFEPNTLKNWLEETFGRLKRTGTKMLSLKSFPYPFETPQFNRIYYVVPEAEHQELCITWELPPAFGPLENYESKPIQYLSNFFSLQGKGTIAYILRKKCWITIFSAEATETEDFSYECCCLLSLKATLTDNGYKNIENVLEFIFAYINFVRENGPFKIYFEQLQQLNAIDFHFNSVLSSPDEYAKEIAKSIRFYKPQDILVGSYTFRQWQPDQIKECLKLLQPFRANFIIYTNEFKQSSEEIGKYFKIRCSHKVIPKKLLIRLTKSRLTNSETCFREPPQNPFITTNFCSVFRKSDFKGKEKVAVPTIFNENELMELWYFPSTEHDDIHANIYLEFITPSLSSNNILEQIMAQLYFELVLYRLDPIQHCAEVAGLDFYRYTVHDGFIFTISGLSQRLPILAYHLAKTIGNLYSKLTESFFHICKRIMHTKFQNMASSPYDLMRNIRLQIYFTSTYNVVLLSEYLERITFDEFKVFSESFITKFKILGYIHGNLTETSVAQLKTDILEYINFSPMMYGIYPGRKYVRQLPVGDTILRLRSQSIESSSVIEVANCYQISDSNMKLYAIASFIVAILDEPAFQVLREQKHLGYSSDIFLRTTFCMIEIVITVSSGSDFGASHIKREIDNFIHYFYNSTIRNMTESKFKVMLENFRKPKVRDETKNWMEIRQRRYQFSGLEESKCLRTLTVKDIHNFFQLYLLDGRDNQKRKLCVQVVSMDDNEYNEVDTKKETGFPLVLLAPSSSQLKSLKKKRIYFVTDIEKFVAELRYFPKLII